MGMELKWQSLDEKIFNTSCDDLVINRTRYLSASRDLTLSTNSSGENDGDCVCLYTITYALSLSYHTSSHTTLSHNLSHIPLSYTHPHISTSAYSQPSSTPFTLPHPSFHPPPPPPPYLSILFLSLIPLFSLPPHHLSIFFLSGENLERLATLSSVLPKSQSNSTDSLTRLTMQGQGLGSAQVSGQGSAPASGHGLASSSRGSGGPTASMTSASSSTANKRKLVHPKVNKDWIHQLLTNIHIYLIT